jgi:hypothetical protein
MNLQIAKRATRLFPRTTYTERKAVKTLRRGWIRAVSILGDKWILASHVQRKADAIVFAVAVIGGSLTVLMGWPT